MASFADQVSSWARESEARMTAVWRRSIELLADEMVMTRPNGGRLPHKTGNLMRSLLGSTVAMPLRGRPGEIYAGEDIGSVTAGLKLGDTVWLGFQANYAHRMNYGFVGEDSLGRSYNREGAHFVEYAVEMWPILVELAAEDVKSSVQRRA